MANCLMTTAHLRLLAMRCDCSVQVDPVGETHPVPEVPGDLSFYAHSSFSL